MIRKFKALGLALVAVFAMSAVVASAVQATAGTLTTFPAGKTVEATATQTGEHEFTLTDHELQPGIFARVHCRKKHFKGVGTVSTGATTVRVEPEYANCTAFGQKATIDVAGCHYVFHMGTKTEGKTGWHVATYVECTGSAVIRITTTFCQVQVGSQGPLSSEVESSGSASPETAMDLLLHTNISNVTYNVTTDSIGCILKGSGVKFKGDYVGNTTVEALDSFTGLQVGLTLH